MTKIGSSNFIGLNQVFKAMIKEMRLDHQMNSIKINQLWKSEMGDFIANKTEKLYYHKGKLIVYVSSAVLKQELFMAKQKICQRLNDKMNGKFVNEVIIK